MSAGDQRHAPATRRNREPIAQVLAQLLPVSGTVLEIASGTGEHAVFFAAKFPALNWQPSDPDPAARASIEAWRQEAGLANLRAPLALDAAAEDWPVSRADAIVCINMVHISRWAATEGLFRGAAGLLPKGGPLILYGPYLEADVATAPSNLEFDRSLRTRDPRWGLRSVSRVDGLAAERGLMRIMRQEMPANNLVIAYARQ